MNAATPTPLPQRLTGIALAILLHLAVAAWWFGAQGAITPPSFETQTMTVSLLNTEQPAPSPAVPNPAPAAKVKPQPTAPKQLTTPARSDAPSTESTPATPASTGVQSAAAAPSGTAAEQPAVVPPRFDAAYLNNPPPPYPGMSRRLNETGRVLLKVKVSAEGLPIDIDIAQSSGFPRLDEAAKEAVRGWKFVPAKQGDKAVVATVQVPIVFKLN